MAKTTIGYSHCPECGSIQAVESDKLKFLIHCTDCKTFTHYQNKAAKNRILEKLLPDMTDELEPIEPEALPVIESDGPTGALEPQPIDQPDTLPDKPDAPRNFFDWLGRHL